MALHFTYLNHIKIDNNWLSPNHKFAITSDLDILYPDYSINLLRVGSSVPILKWVFFVIHILKVIFDDRQHSSVISGENMKSVVYFADLRSTHKENLVNKVGRLVQTAGLSSAVKPRDLVAVKLHFGEAGNTAFIRSVFIRKIIQLIKAEHALPFLTDANTLYAGTRSDAPSHLLTAIQNGFSYASVDAPIIIADGLRGKSEVAVDIDQKNFKRVYIGAEIAQADAVISMAHFKGHELSGFGGDH